jgi:hypothetical protein
MGFPFLVDAAGDRTAGGVEFCLLLGDSLTLQTGEAAAHAVKFFPLAGAQMAPVSSGTPDMKDQFFESSCWKFPPRNPVNVLTASLGLRISIQVGGPHQLSPFPLIRGPWAVLQTSAQGSRWLSLLVTASAPSGRTPGGN